MKTIRTILLIITLLCGIVPATAEVNFTEKTEFLYPEYDKRAATDMYLKVTDPNQITLTSSDDLFTGGLNVDKSKTNLYWLESSCNTGNKSYDKNYFQIYSAETPIKRISLYIEKSSKYNLFIVGWKGAASATADYYKDVSHEKTDGYVWVDYDLSDWQDVKTVRLYGSMNSGSDLIVNNQTRTSSSSNNIEFRGIQVGLSSNTTTIGTYGFSAFSSTSALDFTNVTDCNAYYADSYVNGTLHLTKATGVVPANFGLLLCAPKNATTSVCIPVATATQAAACKLTDNDNVFVATSNITYSPASSTEALALGVKDGKAGFYYVGEGVAVPQNKMYLPAPKVGGAKSVTLDFGGIDPTGIVNVSSDDAANIPSAQRPATDLLGRPVTNPMPGQIYIKDGKAFKLTY
ncbi:MAG: hypothetical protein IKP84_02530 [Prevotella sp.]|nr:hypothetical protein [Prevotella sp.]